MAVIPLAVVDAFTASPFAGNPAAVCLLDGPADPGWMQRVAAEMRHSETAFVAPGSEAFGLRWFTPAVEVELCGHATLAAAHVLWEGGRVDPGEAIGFDTASGRLRAAKVGQTVELDFPARPAVECSRPPGLARALGTYPVWVGRSDEHDLLLELASAEEVRHLRPDFEGLAAVDARGLIVTSRVDDGEHDFVSRFFAPRLGVAEDPVTGSAHCTLGPYWSQRLEGEQLGPSCSPSRRQPAAARWRSVSRVTASPSGGAPARSCAASCSPPRSDPGVACRRGAGARLRGRR
jgi:PhzF family phenazine biosynthesis protein